MSEKQILVLFAVFSLTLHCLRDVYEAEFVAICCILAHFGLSWGLVANWLPERLWEVILACSGLWWPNVSQRDSGGLFWLVLDSVGQMASREVLGTHFGLFWALVANVSQKASEIHFG